MRSRAPLILLAAVLAAGSTASAARRRPAEGCGHLRGTVVLRTHRLEIVRRRDGSDGDGDPLYAFRGCVLPDGVVRTIAVDQDEGLGSISASVDTPAQGAWVEVSFAGGNQYGGSESATLVDVRSGRRYTPFSTSYMIGDPGPGAFLDGLRFDAQGRSAVAIGLPDGYDSASGRPTGITEHVSAFTPGGTGWTLDSGTRDELPAASIALQGGVVSWTKAGVARSATLTLPSSARWAPLTPRARRCPGLAGQVVLSTDQVKVVRRRYGRGIVGGDPLYELLGCWRPNGRVRTLGRAQDEGNGGVDSIVAERAVGTWVSFTVSGSNQYGAKRVTWLADTVTGRRYSPFAWNSEGATGPVAPSLDQLVFDAGGRAATAVSTTTGASATGQSNDVAETVTAYGRDGGGIVLDQGTPSELPPSSLVLDRDAVSWTHGGVPRRVPFA